MREHNQEKQLWKYVNEERVSRGLAPLAYCDHLAKVAFKHTMEQADQNAIYHNSPITGSLEDRLNADCVLYLNAAENVSRTSTLISAHQGYMRSPGHRKNILSPSYTHVGMGVMRNHTGALFTTQVFSKPIEAVRGEITPYSLYAKLNDLRKQKGLPATAYIAMPALNNFVSFLKTKPMDYVHQMPRQPFQRVIENDLAKHTYSKFMAFQYATYDDDIFKETKSATAINLSGFGCGVCKSPKGFYWIYAVFLEKEKSRFSFFPQL